MATIRETLTDDERRQRTAERIAEAADLCRQWRFDEADRLILHANHDGHPAVELFLEIVAQAADEAYGEGYAAAVEQVGGTLP